MVAIFGVFLVVLAVLSSANIQNQPQKATLSWKFHGRTQTMSTIRARFGLNSANDETPMHAENFRANAEADRYDGQNLPSSCRRFMIQGGDFDKRRWNRRLTLESWDGYCNGQTYGNR